MRSKGTEAIYNYDSDNYKSMLTDGKQYNLTAQYKYSNISPSNLHLIDCLVRSEFTLYQEDEAILSHYTLLISVNNALEC